ncbi:MAG TPA: glycoside hydrolase family 78 protein [Sedimentisphaerales bacterium]|nr:glycoside hydrolase family 78 protein [Sedimentisphaerales bacterium]
MRHLIAIPSAWALLFFGGCGTSGNSDVNVKELRCEYRVNPPGIDVVKPRLSWVLESSQRGQKQTAYRLLVAGSEKNLQKDRGDLLDTGKVESEQSVHIEYSGKPLKSRMRCYWKVRVWDKDGRESAWSKPAMWSMGLLEPRDWEARWVGAPPDPDQMKLADEAHDAKRPAPIPAPFLRKSFAVDGNVCRATVYVTGLGLYELRLNGERVGDHILAPEITDYDKRIQYQTYDVTDQIVSGTNAIGAILGRGWYAGRFWQTLPPSQRPFGGQLGLILRLDIEFADGRTQTVVTDESWRTMTDGPIRHNSLYDGELYDARREMPGWDTSGFDDSGWHTAHVPDVADVNLVWQRNEPICVVRELTPVALSEPKDGTYIFDMGQNMVGWCRLKAEGNRGDVVTLRHAEKLNADGSVYTANLRSAKQTDSFVLRGGGSETFEPHFTYHGFRCVEVTGLSKRPKLDDLVGRVFHSASPEAGRFECSSELVNRLMDNIMWTQRGNMHGLPTDCPQRDERAGWMGDIQAFSQTAVFNMDMAGFFNKWALDIRDAQAPDGRYPSYAPHPGHNLKSARRFGVPAWADGGTIVPWVVYLNYGDRRLLEQHFDSARRWVEYVHRNNPNLIWRKERGADYNDWLNADKLLLNGWPVTGGEVPKPVFATAFFAHSTQIVAKMAAALGRKEDGKLYGELFDGIKAAFNKAFVKSDGRIEGDTQAGYVLALHFDLLPDALRPQAVQHLLEGIGRYDGHPSTGIQTTHRLMLELTRNGYHDEACRIVNLRTVPSWGYMIEMGATTMWERWDGFVKGRGAKPEDQFQNPGMNSFNHWAFGSVGEWVWRNIAGINLDEQRPGYEHFIIRPRPGPGFTWAKGEYRSIRGKIAVEWALGDVFKMDVTIPANTTATLYVPAESSDSVTEGGRAAVRAEGLRFLRMEDGSAVFAADSGCYRLVSKLD